jgi:hypothetical protein
MACFRLTPFVLSILGVLMSAAEQASAQSEAPEFALTIYSSAQPGAISPEQLSDANSIPGYALVSDTRTLNLQAGRAELRFSDVAQRMDPTTVAFSSLTDPSGTRVLEQNYQFDLVSQQKLLERYIGETISVVQAVGDSSNTIVGTLLGARDGLLLQSSDGGVRALSNYSSVSFKSLPGGLITKPTLVWLLDTQKAGPHKARVAYQTRGMTWWSDYNVVLSEQDGRALMQLSAWVTLVNQSGASYPQSKIKLVAGEVNRAPVPQAANVVMMRSKVESVMQDESFQESSLFEYHLYTLGRRADVPDNSTKQLELFPAKVNIPAKRELVMTADNLARTMFYGGANLDQGLASQSRASVGAYLEFENRQTAGLGMPLPKGRVRVSQAGPDGSLEFIGEDLIQHTPKNETVRIKLGQSFDVVGDRKQTNYQLDDAGKTLSESFEISVRNRKAAPVRVTVREYLYRWSGWEITDASAKYSKADAQTIDFPIELAADSETTVRYTVRYRW